MNYREKQIVYIVVFLDILGMAPVPFWTSPINPTNIGRIKRGLVAMDCVLEATIAILSNIK